MLDTVFAAATGRVVLAAFIVFAAATVAIRFFSPKGGIESRLKGDYVATDSTFLYDTGRVTDMLRKYRREDYEAHESFILVWDLIYPLCYGIPSILLLAYFCPWRGGAARWLVLLPLATMAFDYAENFTMLAFLRRFRADHATPLGLLEVSRAFTVAKFCVVAVSLAVLVVFAAGSYLRRPHSS